MPGDRNRRTVAPRQKDLGSERSGPVVGAVAGKRAVAEAIRAGLASEVLILEGARETQGLRDVLAAARERSVLIRPADLATLDRLAEDHRGVVAITRLPEPLSESDLDTFDFTKDALVVILDGVTDPQNLGAAARVADGAGAAMLVTRTKRAASVTSAAIRASSGALVTLPHARVANIVKAIQRLQRLGFQVVGLDGDAEQDIYDPDLLSHAAALEDRLAVVIGAEGSGMSRLVAETCDLRLALPMHGRVASLNAATALAAVLYGLVLPGRLKTGR